MSTLKPHRQKPIGLAPCVIDECRYDVLAYLVGQVISVCAAYVDTRENSTRGLDTDQMIAHVAAHFGITRQDLYGRRDTLIHNPNF